MSRTLSSSRWLLAVVACGAVIAAARADGIGGSAPTATQAVGKGHWTRAAADKHNGSGVRLSYSVPAGLQPGQTGRVQLQFSGVTADDARVEWRAPSGSVMTSTQLGAATTMPLPRGQVTTLVLDLTPSADGMAYLDVFTSQGGRTSARSVPLKVGSGAILLKREGTAQTTPAGERVISLPSAPR